MRFDWRLLLASFLIQAEAAALNSRQASTTSLDAIPSCSLTCLEPMVVEYCGGDLTDTVCMCSNSDMLGVLEECVYGACNVTDSLTMEKYLAVSCGIPNDKSRVDQQILTYEILPPIAAFFVAIRFYARWRFWDGIKADDWMILVAQISYLCDLAMGLGMALHGFGEHIYWLSPSDITEAQKFFWWSEMFYTTSYTFPKLSILLFYRRIFPDQKFHKACYCVMAFVITANTVLLFLVIFQCLPVDANWTNWMYKDPPVQCHVSLYALAFTATGFSIFEDLVILLMPIPQLLQLQIHRTKRINLLVMFSVGSVVIMCSCLRIPSLLTLKNSDDQSYDQAPIAVWTNLELFFSIVCACLPACRSLAVYIWRSITGSHEVQDTSTRYAKSSAYSRSRDASRVMGDTHDSKDERLVVGAEEHGTNSLELTDIDEDSIGRTVSTRGDGERQMGLRDDVFAGPRCGSVCVVRSGATGGFR